MHNVVNFVLPHIESFDVELGMVSSWCVADKESSVADDAAVGVLLFHKIEDVVSVMFLLACGWEFWVCNDAAAAKKLSILSQKWFCGPCDCVWGIVCNNWLDSGCK